jgi:molybdenum cofactor synthesis domain-containing protein
MRAPSASLVVVGNEVLSAKVVDENGPWLASRLHELGVELRSIQTVRDRVDEIVEAVLRERPRVGWIITSGGVGPTHDDVTVAAVATALGRPVVRDDRLAEVYRAIHRRLRGAEMPEAGLRMADLPEGTELLGDPSFPTLVCDGVVMLPGVPKFLRYQFDRFAPAMSGAPFHLACVFVSVLEDQIAPALTGIAAAHSEVELGSYPQFDDADHAVKLTLEARDLKAVLAALEALLAALPADAVVRVSRPPLPDPAPPDRKS